ncbi:btb poz domain protein [Cystoisospora suis]|uniref:Btb poz domain protein n=1 Tax=Cystoisospora suis TaxID=483139 RepID=A0A2C6KGX9_9APIC|nr:btb poz domain protein [Cystoisospora suis]
MKDKPGEACVVADQSTNEDGTAVKTPLEEWQWKAIEAGDYALLRKYDTGTTNVDQKSDTYGTPLVTLIDKFIFKSPNNEKEKYLNCIRWLIKRGANPLTTTPGSCTLQISYQKRDNENDKTKRVLVSKKNAIQEDNGPKVLLDKKVISFWESLMLSEDTPDITVTCANGTAKVHSCVLRASSKTFDAMFKHDMMEKRTMTIDLSHLQIEDFKMFRSLLYTGCLEKEPTDDELLDLFELADQYQVQHLCEVLAGHIHNRLSPQNFDKFCHFAITHCSELLKLPCCIYAASNEAVKAQFNGGKLSEPVTEELTKFFGIEVHPSKRRRFSL